MWPRLSGKPWFGRSLSHAPHVMWQVDAGSPGSGGASPYRLFEPYDRRSTYMGA